MATRTRKPTPAQVAGLSQADYLRHRLVETESDITGARKAGSWQALAMLQRQGVAYRADLEALERPAASGENVGANPAEDLSDAELLDALVASVADLPDEALDRLEDAVILRRTGKPRLSVVPG